MLNIKKILFPTDFSDCAERALSHAVYLAQWHHAELHIINVVIVDESDDMAVTEKELLSKAQLRAGLQTATDGQRASGRSEEMGDVSVSEVQQREIKAFRAADAIRDYMRDHDVDLIVMATHGRRGVPRFMLGSVTEEVVRVSPSPVFTISAGEQDVPRRTVRRVLVPVDFSDQTRPGLRHAVELAQTYGAQIDLLHVINPVLFSTPYGFELEHESLLEVRDQAEKMLAELAEEEIGFEHILATVEVGHPTNSIVKYAEEKDVDLIVIPTHGRSGIQPMMMGSVAEKVVRMAPCPVFTVKSFGKSLVEGEADEAGAEARIAAS